MDYNYDSRLNWIGDIENKIKKFMALNSLLLEQKCPKILVVGAGISGRACAEWLSTFDCDIDLVDSRKIELKKNLPSNVTFFSTCIFSKINLRKYHGVVVSPGLSPHEKSENNFFIINKLAGDHGIPIWTEVDLFFSALEMKANKAIVKSKIIAVTGTNGKTTVVSMVKDLLRNLGYDVELAGNVGTSLLDALMERMQRGKFPAFWILELSSFQLFLSSDFKSDVSVILNFSRDHLDWHSSEEEYLNSKLKIFGFPHLRGTPIINADDTDLGIRVEKHISSLLSEKKMPKPIYFGLTENKKKLDVVIAVTKLGNTLILDRETGEPLHNLEYQTAPKSKLDNEVTSKFQTSKTGTELFSKNIFNVESWLIHHGDKLKNRFLLQAYKTMNHLLASIDITRKNKTLEKVVENIQSNIHLIAVDSDLFFTAQEDRKTHERLKKINKNIFYHEIQSIHGHDAFLIENDAVSRILSNIFKSQSNDLKAYESSSQ